MPLGMPTSITKYTLRQIREALANAKNEKGNLKKNYRFY
jgi:hypothetical protein